MSLRIILTQLMIYALTAVVVYLLVSFIYLDLWWVTQETKAIRLLYLTAVAFLIVDWGAFISSHKHKDDQ